MTMTNDFLAGAVVMGFAIVALLFLKFWRSTREGLFLAFAGCFLLLGVSQAILALSRFTSEERSWVYLLRLAAFLLILGGLWWQNRRGRPS